MPALTIDSTTYPCRLFPKRHVPMAIAARVWDDTLVTSWMADNPTAEAFDVEVGFLTESEKDTVLATLRAAGTVPIAGDLPGSTITVKVTDVGFRPVQLQDIWIVTFTAEQVTP